MKKKKPTPDIQTSKIDQKAERSSSLTVRIIKGICIFIILPIVCTLIYESSKLYYINRHPIEILPKDLIINTKESRRYNVYIRNRSNNIIEGVSISFWVSNTNFNPENDLEFIPQELNRHQIIPYLNDGLFFIGNSKPDWGIQYMVFFEKLLPNETKIYNVRYLGPSDESNPFITEINYQIGKVHLGYSPDKDKASN